MNYINNFIKKSIQEDIGNGDHTSICCIKKGAKGVAHLIVKEEATIAGVELAKKIFKYYDQKLKIEIFKKDGEKVMLNDLILSVKGNIQSILATERLVLNCMQRMSGIATKTQKMKSMISAYNVEILDTRKTTPGIRFLEKWAVQIGGGANHRMGLYDAILIKDNHIDYSEGIYNAVQNAVKYSKTVKNIPILVEVRNLDELKEILQIRKINRIILDNFSIKQIKKAVALVNKKIPLEISGNINEKNIKKYAKNNIDYISIGALTHSAKNIDMSLNAEVRQK